MIDNPQRKVLPKEISDKFPNEFDRWMNQGTGDCLDFHYCMVELTELLKRVKENELEQK